MPGSRFPVENRVRVQVLPSTPSKNGGSLRSALSRIATSESPQWAISRLLTLIGRRSRSRPSHRQLRVYAARQHGRKDSPSALSSCGRGFPESSRAGSLARASARVRCGPSCRISGGLPHPRPVTNWRESFVYSRPPQSLSVVSALRSKVPVNTVPMHFFEK